MIFAFYPDIIPDVGEAEIISRETPFHFGDSECLVVRNGDGKRAFKIIYEYHSSPFKEASIVDNLLPVGHEEHFYLYDLQAKRSLLVLKMNWYFGHLYFDEDSFYVADAQGLYKINRKGEINWHNENLGIDGVIVEKFTLLSWMSRPVLPCRLTAIGRRNKLLKQHLPRRIQWLKRGCIVIRNFLLWN